MSFFGRCLSRKKSRRGHDSTVESKKGINQTKRRRKPISCHSITASRAIKVLKKNGSNFPLVRRFFRTLYPSVHYRLAHPPEPAWPGPSFAD